MDQNRSLQQQLLELEERLLNPDIRHWPAELSRLLSDDFIEFGSAGLIYDKESIIRALAAQSSAQILITDFKAVPLAPDMALVTYRATYNIDREPSKYSLRSSIWNLTGGRWQMLFHQGTPI
jgi:hypothetical protein